jgi:hypothetical protein
MERSGSGKSERALPRVESRAIRSIYAHVNGSVSCSSPSTAMRSAAARARSRS